MAAKRTIDPDSKREAILDAGALLFASKGYEATSIADIAAKAGVAVGTVYRLFDDKPALLVAIHAKLEARFEHVMRAAWTSDRPHMQRFKPMIRALFAEMEAQIELMPLLAMVKESNAGGNSGQRLVGAIADLMREAIDAGAFRKVPLPAAAEIAYGMVDAAMRACFRPDHPIDRNTYVSQLDDALRRYLANDEPA
jgi:AcrR family transcriptional regulator